MKRRSFLALLTTGAAALAADQALGAFALPRLFGGDYEPTKGLWTPDLPLVTIPPPLDLASILSMQRAARVVLEGIAQYLPERHERQMIVPVNVAYGFRLGETVLAADLAPAGFKIHQTHVEFLDAGPFVLNRNYHVRGGFSPRVLHDMKTDDEAYEFLDQSMLAPSARMLAQHIESTGWNVFAPPAHVQFGEESVIATSRKLHLTLRASRYWDAERRSHELQFDILGGRA